MTTVEPEIRRKFVLADLHNNHNKFWLVEYWPDGRLKTTWGRVGVAPQCKEKRDVSTHAMQKLIREKETKGYVEIDLYRPAAPAVHTSGLDARVAALVQLIYTEANDRIASYLAVGLDALSQWQITEGRARLLTIQQLAANVRHRRDRERLAEAVEQYFNVIPTRLPARIEIDEVVNNFVANLAEHEDRLNQLEAALASQHPSTASALPGLDGVELDVLAQDSRAFQQIEDYVHRTAGGARVRDIFTVTILAERDAWEQERHGKKNVRALFHGTRACNVRHILRSGLIIPQMPSNGSRWGRGIYFADMSRRSLNYCSTRSASYKLLFIADVALGKAKKMDGDDPTLRKAPRGHDSVWGIKSYSGMDEYVIYRTSQQTIRAIATING
jgi:poly [ADP-ribose] polymerase